MNNSIESLRNVFIWFGWKRGRAEGLAASTITNRVHDAAASCKTKRRPVTDEAFLL